MKTIIDNIQTKLQTIPGLKHVDEDWGQLDYYSPNFPVQWPCALIDISDESYTDTGKDRTKTPQQRQMGDCSLTLSVANLKLTNSSGRAPKPQKDNARSIRELINDVHSLLHGWNPEVFASKLIRRRVQRVKRDDGVQEYTLTYSFSLTDV